MKTLKFLPLTFLLFLAVQAVAQKLPFQGKLLENGQPANGAKSITFALTDGSWTETHSVTVTDGLYTVVLGSITPMPLDIFDYSSERDLSISVEGEMLPNITLYAPLGKFTSIPNNPTGEFVVGQPDTINVDVASNATNTNQVAIDSAWQSFVPEKNGTVTQASLYFANFNNTDVRLRILEGEGLGGNVLYDSLYAAANFGPAGQDQVFPVPTVPGVVLKATQEYTLQWLGESGKFSMNINENNPYAAGRSSQADTTDLQFAILIDEVIPIAFKSDLNGNVGVGTDSPGARLHVRGSDYSDETSAFLVTNYLNDTLANITNDGGRFGKSLQFRAKSGVGTLAPNSSSTRDTIFHDLGVTPVFLEMKWQNYNTTRNECSGIGTYNGESQNMLAYYHHSSHADTKYTRISSTNIIEYFSYAHNSVLWKARVESMNEEFVVIYYDYYFTSKPVAILWKVYY